MEWPQKQWVFPPVVSPLVGKGCPSSSPVSSQTNPRPTIRRLRCHCTHESDCWPVRRAVWALLLQRGTEASEDSWGLCVREISRFKPEG